LKNTNEGNRKRGNIWGKRKWRSTDGGMTLVLARTTRIPTRSPRQDTHHTRNKSGGGGGKGPPKNWKRTVPVQIKRPFPSARETIRWRKGKSEVGPMPHTRRQKREKRTVTQKEEKEGGGMPSERKSRESQEREGKTKEA